MLVLSRKEGESILIGNDIRVTVCRIKSSREVSIGIEAPPHITIDRLEVHEQNEQWRDEPKGGA